MVKKVSKTRTKSRSASSPPMGAWNAYTWDDLQAQLKRIESRVNVVSGKLDLLLPALGSKLDSLLPLISKESQVMATLQDVLAKVHEERTDIDSIITLVAGLKQQVADALANAGVPPDVQAQIDEVFNAVESNKDEVHNAVQANQTPQT